MLKLLRTLPKVLKYLPSDKAADARNFMMSFQYWLGGSPENVQVIDSLHMCILVSCRLFKLASFGCLSLILHVCVGP